MRKFAFALAATVIAGGFSKPAQADEESTILPIIAVVSDESSSDDEKSTQELDSKESQEVIVEVRSSTEESSSDESADDDVKPAKKVRGRIIMIGPDGERKEMELDEKQLMKFHLDVNDGKAVLKKDDSAEDAEAATDKPDLDEPETEERYVIGVQCEEADDILRKHMKLEGKGLLVLEVREKTPAAEAGLKVDDVIVAVGESTLQSRDDLVTAVHESEGKELTVHVLRAGEAQSIQITPKKMKVPVVREQVATVEGFPMPNIILQNGKPMTALPGLFIEGQPQDPQDLGKVVQRLQKEYLLQADQEKSKLEDEMESLRTELKALRDEIKQLQKSVKGE